MGPIKRRHVETAKRAMAFDFAFKTRDIRGLDICQGAGADNRARSARPTPDRAINFEGPLQDRFLR